MYYFIVNPSSCCGRGGKIWRRLERYLRHEAVEYEAYLTREQGDARAIARQLTEGIREPRMIVAVGGDGTVNEVLDGLAFSASLTIGYIPAGAGNDLAKSLKLPRNPIRCVKKILRSKYHKLLDYGILCYGENEIAHRRFLIGSGIGFDASVCHAVMHSRLRRVLCRIHLGRLAYMAMGLKLLLGAKKAKGYLLLDGAKRIEFNHILFISANIHPYVNGGFKIAPKADYSDGKLQLCVVSHNCRLKLLPIMLSSFGGRHSRYKGVRNYECREAVIHTDRPMPVHVDGESCLCQSDIQIQCIQKKVRIIV